jgi:hypothetical protein
MFFITFRVAKGLSQAVNTSLAGRYPEREPGSFRNELFGEGFGIFCIHCLLDL